MLPYLHTEDNMLSSLHTADNIVITHCWTICCHQYTLWIIYCHLYTLWNTAFVITYCGTILELISLHTVRQWLEPEIFRSRVGVDLPLSHPRFRWSCGHHYTLWSILPSSHTRCATMLPCDSTPREKNPSLTATPKNRLPSLWNEAFIVRQLVTSGIASDSGTVYDQGARDQWFDDELINNRNASAELTENMYAPCKDEEPVCCEVVNCFLGSDSRNSIETVDSGFRFFQ